MRYLVDFDIEHDLILVLIEIGQDVLNQLQLGRRRLDDHHIAAGRVRLVERGNLAAGGEKGGQRRSCLLRGEVAKVEGLDHERLEPWTIGRIVCINEDRPVIDLLEGVLVDLQDDVERLGHRHFIQLDRYR